MSDENKEQIEFWNGRPGARWGTYQESLDRVLRPIGNLTIAAISPGEYVIDVGCGCGATTLTIQGKVGVSGSVLRAARRAGSSSCLPSSAEQTPA